MSTRTQRLANNFPIWTKIRRDPSSLGQRFFSVAADYLDFQSANLVKLKESSNLFDSTLPHGEVFYCNLNTDEQVEISTGISGFKTYSYPDVMSGINSIDRVETIEELLFGPPTSIDLNSSETNTQSTVWLSTDQSTYNTIYIPNRLTVRVFGSTNYKTPDDVEFSGFSNIKLEGKDINGSVVEEVLRIQDDGYYQTKFVYSELTAVSWEGFNGYIAIHASDKNKDFCQTKYWLGASDEVEGPLYLQLSTHQEMACLEYYTTRYKNGAQYKKTGVTTVDNEEHLGWQYLLDSEGAAYIPVDFAISDQNNLLYVLDTGGNIYVYDVGLNSFSAYDAGATPEADIVLDSITPYSRVEESVRFFTRHERLRNNIVSVSIKRVSPSTTVEYLQADLTWDAASYSFPGNPEAARPEDSWKDFSFTTLLNTLGQWNFIVTITTINEIQVYHTAVLIDTQEPLSTVTSEINNCDGIYFNWDGRIVVAEEAGADTNFSFFTESVSKCYFDPNEQKVWFRNRFMNLLIDGTSYTAVSQQLRTYVDVHGAELGCFRFPQETMSNFYKRILLEIFDPASSSDQDFKRVAGRTLGLLDIPVMKVTLVLNGDGESDAADPYFEITSTHIRAYDDYANEVLAFEINLLDLEDGYFLNQVEAIINASTNFAAVLIGTPSDYIKSSTFRVDNSEKIVSAELLNNTGSNKLQKQWIKSIRFTDFARFQTEQNVSSDVNDEGDYYIDYQNGTVLTHTPASGFASYVYRDFPFTIYSQQVRAYNLNDNDIDYKIKDFVKDHSTGGNTPKILKPLGSRIYNDVYRIAPNQWGK